MDAPLYLSVSGNKVGGIFSEAVTSVSRRHQENAQSIKFGPLALKLWDESPIIGPTAQVLPAAPAAGGPAGISATPED